MFVFGGEAPAGTFNEVEAYCVCRRRGTASALRW